MRLDILRVLLDRLAERMLGFLELLVLLKQGAEIVVGLRIDRALDQRILIGLDAPSMSPVMRSALPRLLSASAMVGRDLERLAIIFDRLAELPPVVMDDAEVVQRLGIVGIELDRLFERVRGIVGLAGAGAALRPGCA